MADRMDIARKKLAERGYKWTGQRREIIKVLFNNSSRHVSAEELHQIIRAGAAEIGLATVYRTLDMLSEVGLIHKLQFGDGRSRYEVADDDHHHHHHICNECGEVLEVPLDLLEKLEKKIEQEYNVEIIGHHLKFFGLCSKCKEQ